jgi:hypothetical protein
MTRGVAYPDARRPMGTARYAVAEVLAPLDAVLLLEPHSVAAAGARTRSSPRALCRRACNSTSAAKAASPACAARRQRSLARPLRRCTTRRRWLYSAAPRAAGGRGRQTRPEAARCGAGGGLSVCGVPGAPSRCCQVRPAHRPRAQCRLCARHLLRHVRSGAAWCAAAQRRCGQPAGVPGAPVSCSPRALLAVSHAAIRSSIRLVSPVLQTSAAWRHMALG